jgi:surfactin synthase thioesterase subunit
MRLLCFPYAGGSAIVYRDWPQHLPSSVEVVPVELPGRGTRSKEPLFDDLCQIIDGMIEEMSSLVDLPFAFFGHSMGAAIAFEMARRLRNDGLREPGHLFMSGRRAPQRDASTTHDLPHDEFIGMLRKLGGTPQEVLADAELMELMIPILRADFRASQSHKFLAGKPLGCAITAFGGLQDTEVRREDLLAWKEQTTSKFAMHMLPGDHFFLNTARIKLLGLIARASLEMC